MSDDTDDTALDDIDRHRLSVATAHFVQAGLDVSYPTELTVCPHCDRPRDDIRRRRMNTAYADEERNWTVCCMECFQDTVEHYEDMWDSYYRDCL